jgi:hypothetical protein
MTNSNSYVMSDDTALGVFDTDGTVLLNVEKRNEVFQYRVFYALEQSSSKADLVSEVAKKFNDSAKLYKSGKTAGFKANCNSLAGQKVRAFLLKNKPLNPGRRRDFLISEEVIKLLKTRTKMNQVILLRLISNKTVLQYTKNSIAFFDSKVAVLNCTPAELKEGIDTADALLVTIEKEVNQLTTQLPSMKLSEEYTRGAHFGDGSLSVSLTFKDPKRYRIIPTWSISGADKAYCSAFKNTYGGSLRSVKNHVIFLVNGIEANRTVISLLERAGWLPQYKREQLNRFKKVVELLHNDEHFTEVGLRQIVDLAVNQAEKGKAKYSKQEYIDMGIVCLKTLKYIS